MSSKSKQKGKSFENKVAKMICKIFEIDNKYIKRSGSSGVRLDEHGDIDINHPKIEQQFPFVIECKKNEKWKFNDLLGIGTVNKSNIFLDFISQSITEIYNDKYGLIVFSKNYEDVYGLFYSDNTTKNNEMFETILQLLENKMISHIGEYKILVFRFEEFLERWYIQFIKESTTHRL